MLEALFEVLMPVLNVVSIYNLYNRALDKMAQAVKFG
jgi:hypothetical protein